MRYLLAILFPLLLLSSKCDQPENDQGNEDLPKVLVFSKTAGYRHASIEDGQKAIRELGKDHSFAPDFTEDSTQFNPDNLKQYAAVVFLNTTLDVLGEQEQVAFQEFIRSGKGFVGIHSATDTEYDWPWYGELVGAYFNGHPAIQQATVHVRDHSHPATEMLDSTWVRTDEWYNFKNFNEGVNVLLTLDESTYEGGTMGDFHPLAWYHEYDGGRAFYTEMGHTKESFYEPLYRQHLLGGIKYALGSD